MKILNIGPVLFSSQVLELMILDSSLAAIVGKKLAHHVQESDPQVLELGGKAKTTFYPKSFEFVIVTELDKNQMPRTSIVLRTENGEV